MGRKQAREGTMKLIYQMEINDDFSDEALSSFLENFSFDQAEKEYITDAYVKIKDNLKTIDTYIENTLDGWKINRLAKVDLAILRVALYEILYRDDIPIEVSINEAIEIAKKYSNEDSYRFINGVLGSIVRSLDKDNNGGNNAT
ncbi:MAG TPA: transcription antitermination factor NusB [Tissierellaceae bacterium]